VVLQSRAKAVAHKFSDTFYKGDDTVDTKSFDGLAVRTPAGQSLSMGANGAALTLDKLDELIDLVKPGRPNALLMHKRTCRKLNSLRRASGAILETSVMDFGLHVLTYDGIPILVSDVALSRSEMAACQSIRNRPRRPMRIQLGSAEIVPRRSRCSYRARRSARVA
jgi:hypothetical protein